MKIKIIFLVLSLVAGENLKAADAVVPAVGDLREQTATPSEINGLVDAGIRERRNAMQRFGSGQDGLFWRTAHKVRSGASLVGHVFKYPAVALCGIAGPLYWCVKDEFYDPLKSFIRENFTVVAGVIGVGGLGLGLYYGPKDHTVTEGYKALQIEVADHEEIAKELVGHILSERRINDEFRRMHESLEDLKHSSDQAARNFEGLKAENVRTTAAVNAAKDELTGLKDEAIQIRRRQIEERIVRFITMISDAIQKEQALFSQLKAIQDNPATAGDVSLLNVTLFTMSGVRVCEEALNELYLKGIEDLPEDLRLIVDQFNEKIAPYLEHFNIVRGRVDELCLKLKEQHKYALMGDSCRLKVLAAASGSGCAKRETFKSIGFGLPLAKDVSRQFNLRMLPLNPDQPPVDGNPSSSENPVSENPVSEID